MKLLRGLVAASCCIGMASPALADSKWTWAQGQPPVIMEPTATSMCLLTRVFGKFRGAGELVEVVAEGKSWVLRGRSQQEGVSAIGRCVPLARFTPKAAARAHARFTQNWEGASKGCTGNDADGAPGDAAMFISAFGGSFRGGGEYVLVKPSSSPTAKGRYLSQTCRDSGQINVSVTAFRVGDAGKKLVRMLGPNGGGDAAKAGEWRVTSNAAIPLALLTDGVCGLTWISGQFDGGGEGVTVYPQGDRWMLRAAAKSGSGTRAGARCMAYQQ